MTQHIPAEDRTATPPLPEPDQWLAEYGDALYRFALDRLRRPHEAEEAVQETLLAALKARSQFRGQSHPRTWMTAILKRKIWDRLRASSREAAEADPAELDAWFDSSGHWRKSPRAWANPAEAVERAEFWGVVRNCLAKLPPRMAEAFTLRTLDDCGPEEVCRELAISSANLWVLLHRARLRLVRCLEINWFDSERQS